jgi:hypothetical protein
VRLTWSNPIPLIKRHIGRRCVLLHTCIGHEDVDPSEGRDKPGEHVLHVRLARHIRVKRNAPAAVTSHVLDKGGCLLGLAQVVYADSCAGSGKSARDCGADA